MENVDLTDLDVFKLSMDLADTIYSMSLNWQKIDINTIGYQIIRSADSIAANIAEGYGRYYFKDNIRFCYYARGSLLETKTWLMKLNRRNIIDSDNFQRLNKSTEEIHVKLNSYIRYLKSRTK